MKETAVTTDRLYMIPQSLEELALRLEKEMDGDMKKAYGDMIETMKRLPGQEEWGSEWKISLASGLTIGGIGFGIDAAYQGNGYATEAVNGMVKWAFAQENVRCVTAQTEQDNNRSKKVLRNNGFVRDGNGEEGPLYKIHL